MGPRAGVFGQRLKHRRVLAVNRQQHAAALPHRLHEHGATHDDGFLVGQQQAFASASGCETGRQTCGPHNSRHHHLHFGVGTDLTQGLLTGQDLHGQSLGFDALGQVMRSVWARHDRVTGGKCPALRQHRLHLA